jgi:hypothetical protein
MRMRRYEGIDFLFLYILKTIRKCMSCAVLPLGGQEIAEVGTNCPMNTIASLLLHAPSIIKFDSTPTNILDNPPAAT